MSSRPSFSEEQGNPGVQHIEYIVKQSKNASKLTTFTEPVVSPQMARSLGKDAVFVVYERTQPTLGPKFVLKQSTLENCSGWGLFAARDFDKNELITVYTGKKKYKRPENTDYVIEVEYSKTDGKTKEKYYLDASDQSQWFGMGQFINDYSRGFATGQNVVISKEDKTEIRAKKTIKAGDELFLSYGQEYWKHRCTTTMRPHQDSSSVAVFRSTGAASATTTATAASSCCPVEKQVVIQLTMEGFLAYLNHLGKTKTFQRTQQTHLFHIVQGQPYTCGVHNGTSNSIQFKGTAEQWCNPHTAPTLVDNALKKLRSLAIRRKVNRVNYGFPSAALGHWKKYATVTCERASEKKAKGPASAPVSEVRDSYTIEATFESSFRTTKSLKKGRPTTVGTYAKKGYSSVNYQDMEEDEKRTLFYKDALGEAFETHNDAVVVDIGTGGRAVLALLATSVGFSRVAALEVNKSSVRQAEDLLTKHPSFGESTPIGDRQTHITSFTNSRNTLLIANVDATTLDKKTWNLLLGETRSVPVFLVFELFGDIGSEEGVLEIVTAVSMQLQEIGYTQIFMIPEQVCTVGRLLFKHDMPIEAQAYVVAGGEVAIVDNCGDWLLPSSSGTYTLEKSTFGVGALVPTGTQYPIVSLPSTGALFLVATLELSFQALVFEVAKQKETDHPTWRAVVFRLPVDTKRVQLERVLTHSRGEVESIMQSSVGYMLHCFGDTAHTIELNNTALSGERSR